jgi:hypothetical protein
MTVPWLMNCEHSDDVLCIFCVANLHDELHRELTFKQSKIEELEEEI